MFERTDYYKLVKHFEANLNPCAKRSFEDGSQTFIGGNEAFEYFENIWNKSHHSFNSKISNRTPLQIQRDRILYSYGMRKQTEKYHVLYNNRRKVVRSYATHTMKMAQVVRAICRGLDLNQDFAEAIALGSKVGSVPFIHAAKEPINRWAKKQLRELDSNASGSIPNNIRKSVQLELFSGNEAPSFIDEIKSPELVSKVGAYMPWYGGSRDAPLYSSGAESFWLLCTNPFTNELNVNSYYPETVYGIWRHTRGLVPGKNPFYYKCTLSDKTSEISDEHATFEAAVVQESDDITWVIENLSDANDLSIICGDSNERVFERLRADLGSEINQGLNQALDSNDSGGIYNYFITDYIQNSVPLIEDIGDDFTAREKLAKGELSIGLSVEAKEILSKMMDFLRKHVFLEIQTENRKKMLEEISIGSVNLIYESDSLLLRLLEERSKLEKWKTHQIEKAKALLNDPVHKMQLSIDVLASWSDREIYDFVGIQFL